MDYIIYKLKFRTPVHFGKGRLSSSINTIYADTLFSALCIEAKKLYGSDKIEELYRLAGSDELVLSDAMPYIDDTLYVPKPIVSVNAEKRGDSVLKKKFKKLKYIPVGDISAFVSGNYVPKEADFGAESVKTSVRIKDDDDNEPYNVGLYHFYDNSGLYFITGSADDACSELIDTLIESLSYTGIGGKTTSGFGKFDYTYEEPDEALLERIKKGSGRYMSLSLSLPREDELSSALNGASYELIKRSGFVASYDYSNTPLKKRDIYCFKGGSCFLNRFEGDIYDLSSEGRHPVYRYAKPFFIGLE